MPERDRDTENWSWLQDVSETQRAYPCPRCKKKMESIEEAEEHSDRCRGDGLPGPDEIPILGEER